MAGIKVRGTFEVADGSLEFTLEDGRVVAVRGDGSVHVWAGRDRWGSMASNNYRVTLPTFEEVAERCDQDGDGTFTVEARHVH